MLDCSPDHWTPWSDCSPGYWNSWISSFESLLTWLSGASLGVSTPATATVTPSTEYDRSKIIGTMLKIQGSTRSAKDMQSSKLVWSLEENEQQSTGLPREFTFVFLVEQPVAKAPFSLQIGIKPVFSHDIEACSFGDEITQKSDILSDEVGRTCVTSCLKSWKRRLSGAKFSPSDPMLTLSPDFLVAHTHSILLPCSDSSRI